MTTKVQVVRFDLVGANNAEITRVGTVLLYAPLLIIGYLLLLGSLMRLVAIAWGWGVTFLVFGLVHLTMGVWGIWRGKSLGVATTFDVLDPAVGPRESATDGVAVAGTATSKGATEAAAPTRLPFPFPVSGAVPGRGMIGARPGSHGPIAPAPRHP